MASRRAMALAAVLMIVSVAATPPAAGAIYCPALTNAPDDFPLTSATMIFFGLGRDGTSVRASRFVAPALDGLRVRVQWTEVASGQVQRLELVAPDGSVYQRKTTTLEKVRPTQIRPVTVDVEVPVAGSWIPQHGMYGRWCARAYLEGEPVPVVQRSFFLSAE